MWGVMGLAGAGLGLVAGDLAERHGLWRPLVISWLLLAAAMVVLALAPASTPLALVSAALFGAGFTVGYAQIAVWSQVVFTRRPTTGFTATIVCTAAGFTIGPVVLGLVAAELGRGAALLTAALPAVAVVAVRPSREDRRWS